MSEDRAFAASFFNAVWKLLDKSPRSAAEDMQMIHLAHASRAHWQVAGGPREWSIGEWQIARVYAALGRGEPALVHARAALDLARTEDLGPFLLGCGHEVMARACRAAGHEDQALAHHAEASAIARTLEDTEERELLLLDLQLGRG